MAHSMYGPNQRPGGYGLPQGSPNQYGDQRQSLVRSLANMARVQSAGRTSNQYGFHDMPTWAVDPRLAMLARNPGENFQELQGSPQAQQLQGQQLQGQSPDFSGIGPSASDTGQGLPDPNGVITGFGQPAAPPIGPQFGLGSPQTQWQQSGGFPNTLQRGNPMDAYASYLQGLQGRGY
jgi:hypothetical protein